MKQHTITIRVYAEGTEDIDRAMGDIEDTGAVVEDWYVDHRGVAFLTVLATVSEQHQLLAKRFIIANC